MGFFVYESLWKKARERWSGGGTVIDIEFCGMKIFLDALNMRVLEHSIAILMIVCI